MAGRISKSVEEILATCPVWCWRFGLPSRGGGCGNGEPCRRMAGLGMLRFSRRCPHALPPKARYGRRGYGKRARASARPEPLEASLRGGRGTRAYFSVLPTRRPDATYVPVSEAGRMS
jgi:hypothetical protein